MLIPLIDTLRCVQPHADTWLVASIDRADARDMLDGFLGCPTCLAEYPVREGVVAFSSAIQRSAERPGDEGNAMRLAAALDLTEPSMTAVLHGGWGAHAPILRGISPANVILVNPPEGIASGDGISIVVAETAPLARVSVSAVAFDATASGALIESLIASVRPSGRVLGPATTPVPAGLSVIARDDDVWVAQTDASAISAPILPTRRSRESS